MTDIRNLTDNERAFLADWICFFNLDLMPGMQMDIDAALNNYELTEEQARERRDLVQYIYKKLDDFRKDNQLDEFFVQEKFTRDMTDENKDTVACILDDIKSREEELLSDYDLVDYDSFDNIDLYELEDVDIDGKKAIQDFVEYKKVVLTVDELLKENADTTDPKTLHRIRKDFEVTISHLRGIKHAKNEETKKASSICASIDDLISICKQGTKRLISVCSTSRVIVAADY